MLQLEFGCPFLHEAIAIYYCKIHYCWNFDNCKTNCSNCSTVADCFVVSQQCLVGKRFVWAVLVLLDFTVILVSVLFFGRVSCRGFAGLPFRCALCAK